MRKLALNRAAYLALTCAVFVLLAASSAKADTLYTTGGTPPNFNPSTFQIGIGPTGESFVPTETATLTDVIVTLKLGGEFSSSPAAVTVYVESSSSGAPSGTILDTLTTTDAITNTPHDLTFTCTVCSQLVSGTTYDIVLQQTETGGGAGTLWIPAFPNVFGTIYFDNSGDPTSTSWDASTGVVNDIGAFEVDGTPVASPEPSSLLLLGAGLLALAFIGRKKFAAGGPAQG